MPEETDESFFKAICQNANIAMLAGDRDLKIRFWNAAAARLFGGSSETMLGESMVSIIPADHRDLAMRIFERALAHGEAGEMEIRLRNPAGEPVYLVLMIAAIQDQEGERAGISVLVRDISKRIERHKAAIQSERMSALGAMAGAVAHHFNNLLCGLVTSADFAQASSDPEMLRRTLKSIVLTLTRASKITLAMQAFAEGDHTRTDRAEAVLIIERFIESMRPVLIQRGIALQVALEPVTATLPVRQITTILDSLVTNACEAMSTGGTLAVSLLPSPDGEHVIIRIADTGKGIAEENLEHIFEPFFTTKSASAGDSVEHRGLSLAVVHGIVRNLGGSVTFCSSAREGTVFAVQLPCDLG